MGEHVVVGWTLRRGCRPAVWPVLEAACLALSFLLALLFSAPASAQEISSQNGGELCLSDGLERGQTPLSQPTSAAKEVSVPLLSNTALRAIRIVVIASGDFTAGRSDAQVFDNIDSVLRSANEYLRPLRLSLELAGVQSFQPGAGDPYADPAKRHDAGAMLDIARAEWTGRTFPQHDLVAVFGLSAFGSTYGLAYPYTLCLNKNFAFLFASQSGTSELAQLNFGATLAHEVGHSVGMSHDPTFYADGPSLMWPFFAANVNGFSSFSLQEFSDFETGGGTACLSEIPGSDAGSLGTPDTLAFAGGATQEVSVAEGRTLRQTFPVAGSFPGVTYSATSLPPGATFDDATGTLVFTPGYDLLQKKKKSASYNVAIDAQTFQLKAHMLLKINVTAQNQAPVISADDATLTEGVRAQLQFTAADDDQGDTVTLRVVNKKELKNWPGKPRLQSRGARASLDWTPPAGSAGAYNILFSATDKSGGVTLKQVVLTVQPPFIAPNIVGPTQVLAADGKPLSFALTVSGGSAAHDFAGLEPGMLIRDHGGSIEVQYAPAGNLEQDVNLQLVMRSQQGFLRHSIPVHVPQGLSLPGVVWPGNAAPVGALNDVGGDGDDDTSFYDSLSGSWRHVSCAGVTSSATFGGFPGDVPQVVHRGKSAYRAIFRIVNGQGFWFVDDGSAPVQFGRAGDVPLVGDVDGDGTDELTIYRPLTREWIVLVGGDAVSTSTPFFNAEDERVVTFLADVDGDGKADFSRFRRTDDGALLFEVRLGDGSTLTAVVDKTGLSQVVTPFVLDIDGDGRADFGVQTAGAGVQWFNTATGKLVSLKSTVVPSQGIYSARRCGAAGAELLGFDQINGGARSLSLGAQGLSVSAVSSLQASITEVSPESARLRLSNRFAGGSFGDLDRTGQTSLAVLRSDPKSGTTQWMSRVSGGVALSYLPMPDNFSFQSALNVSSAFRGELATYGDGAWVTQSASGSSKLGLWGQFGDVAVPGDYNGDGRSDLAIYRSSDSSWWILFSNASGDTHDAKVVRWGRSGDIPVPADYDGDGATDIAIWRPSSGTWAILFADGRVRTQVLGSGTDIPVPGDYLGTGRKELAVFRAATGSWLIQAGASKTSAREEQWGFGDDTPVTGDFDGDGQDDLAVFRGSEGNWYFRNVGDSSGRVIQFGLPRDIPLGGQKTLRIF